MIFLGIGSEGMVDLNRFLEPTKRALALRAAYRCPSILVDQRIAKTADTPPGNRQNMDLTHDWFERF